MKRALSVLAAVVAVAIGASLRPVPAPIVAPAMAPDAWAAANGLHLQSTERLTATGIYLEHRFAGPPSCVFRAIPLGSADEIMPTLHDLLSDADWNTSRLLLAGVGPMPRTALGVHVRRILARLTHGHAPQPVMLVASPACQSALEAAHPTEWPAP